MRQDIIIIVFVFQVIYLFILQYFISQLHIQICHYHKTTNSPTNPLAHRITVLDHGAPSVSATHSPGWPLILSKDKIIKKEKRINRLFRLKKTSIVNDK